MSVDSVAKDQIAEGVKLLRRGKLVAFPTETVYGLGADASNPEALERLYQAKGRPARHPVIVHIADVDQLKERCIDVPESAFVLAAKFWPGPMTLVLKRAPQVLDQITGGRDTIGIRIPNHPFALALLKEFKGGLAAPSANKFGRLSPTRAIDVEKEFGEEVALVLEGGPCEVGIESTIVDLTGSQPRILRPGMISKDDLQDALQCGVEDTSHSRDPNLESFAPGTLPSHYAPSTPVVLKSAKELANFVESELRGRRKISVLSVSTKPIKRSGLLWITAPPNPERYARMLYANMRELDSFGAAMIVVEIPPDDSSWTGICDRLTRAAHVE